MLCLGLMGLNHRRSPDGFLNKNPSDQFALCKTSDSTDQDAFKYVHRLRSIRISFVAFGSEFPLLNYL
jgi:trehalose-6-phosphatase